MTRSAWLLLLALLTLVPPSSAQSLDDFQAWLGLNTILWEEGKWNFSFWTEARFRDDLSSELGYFAGPGTRWRMHPNWNLDAAVRFILFRTEPDDLHLVRYQLAITPHLKVGSRARFSLRNRAEWITSRGDLQFLRIRHKAQINWPLGHLELGKLSGVYLSEELFYRWDEWDITQSRFIPLGLIWQCGPRWRVSTYYMVHYLHELSSRRDAFGLTAVLKLDP